MPSERFFRWPSLLAVAALFLVWRLLTIGTAGITLHVDEAQYWGWAQQLSWGYFSKPPGIAALIAASTALFGDGVLGSKALAMLCYPLSALLVYGLVRDARDARAAWWCALALLSLPIFAWLGLAVTTDALLVLAWSAMLRLYVDALRDDRLWRWLLLGLVCGAGLLSKYTMLAGLLSALLHLLLCERQRLARPGPWLAAGLALLCLAPNLWWNIQHDFPTLRHTAKITVERDGGGPLALLEFVASQWGCFGPLLGAAFIAALPSARQRTPAGDFARLLLCFALPLWLLAIAQAYTGKANANWAAPAFIPATILAVLWLRDSNRQRWLTAAVVLNIAIGAIIYHGSAVLRALGANPPTPYAQVIGWDRLAQQLEPWLEAYPQAIPVAGNRTLIAHLQYELRDRHLSVARWNPDGSVHDHYELTQSQTLPPGAPLLYLSTAALPSDIASRFARHEHLVSLSTESRGPKTTRQLEVYLLDDFQKP